VLYTLATYKEKALSTTVTLSQIIELARIADPEPLDFGMIEIDEETVYKRIALATLDSFNKTEEPSRDIVFLAAVINLHVRNYVLNMEKYQLHSTIDRLTKQLEKLKK
jgi:hypothetical protein